MYCFNGFLLCSSNEKHTPVSRRYSALLLVTNYNIIVSDRLPCWNNVALGIMQPTIREQ